MGQSLSESQKRLRKNEILYEIRFNVGQDGARVLQLVPVAAGTRAREKYSEKAGKALPTQDAAIALRQARWHLRSIEKAIQENPTDQALQTERAESAYRVDQLERAHEPFMSKNMTVLDVATAHINARVATIRSVPEAALPEAYHREVNSRILASKVGLKSAEEMLNIMGIPKDPTGKRTIRLKHMPSIEQMLMRIEAAPVEDRMHIMMEPWKDRNHLDHPELTGDLKKDQAEIDSIPKRNLRQRISEAVAEQKRTGAPMLQTLFRLTVPETLLDFRYFALKMQERTPIPMWDIGVRIANAMHLRDNKVAVVSRWLQPFARSTSEDHQVVKQYFTNLYSGIGDVNLVKTPTQQAFIDAITSMMQEVAPDVVKYRHRKWMLNVLYPQQEGTVSNVKVFKLQNNPKVRAMLEEGARIYEQAQADHNWDPYEMWVDRAIAQNLGVIQSGAYLPGHILNVKPIKLEVLDEVGHISALGRTAGEMRESNIINGEDASHMIVDQFRGQNLIVQLNNYLNQIYNLRYLGEPMNLLSEAVDFYKPYLEGAKEKASTRRGSEARAYSTLDYLKIYAARAKGYPMKMELPSRLLRGAQTVFFRALTVKPNTWLRNMWQGVHTVPHKEFVTDVRFSAPKFSFKHLPENAMSFYDIATDGSTDFAKFFLGIHSTGQLSKYNILDKALQLVENVGKVFAKTDDINRRTVFAKTWFRSKFYLDKYAAGDIERHNMYNRLGIDKMKPLEQRTFRELLQAKDNEQAASFIADWQVKNSQWVYNRAARSLAEMTPGGEAWSNLLTWTKSLVQQNVNCLHQIKDGLERAKTVEGNAWDINTPRGRAYRQAMHGGLQIGGLVLASAVGNAIMANATLSHKTKFTSYGWGALTWEFGGVTNAVLTEFTTTLADVVQAFDGTDEDRKMSFEKLAKIGDNMALRQLVPFAKQALSIMEAATNRSYIAPVYELMTKITRGQSRGVTQVDRTVLERLTHAVFGTDPSKSKEIRELAYKSREEYQYKYMHAQNPVEREYYRLALARARYFADLFTRYEPIEVFKHWEEKEREKYMKEMQDHSQEDYIKEMQRLAREERKQKMGY